MLFVPNQKIGPYILIRELGHGAFGSVWLAEEEILEGKVALKLPRDEDADPEAVKREAKVWRKAGNHKNVVPVLQAWVDNGQIVIASEYVAGGTLAEWLRKHGGQAPSAEAAVAMISGILWGLEHLHGLQPHALIHRDLKPANVLLSDETPRITDFGVSRVLKTTDHSHNVAGTPSYMAPETFEGEYSIQSDLWAVGVMLYAMLAGRLPFRNGANLVQQARIIERDEPYPLTDSVPAHIQQAIAKAMQKDPMLRFGSAQEMRDALQPPRAPIRPLPEIRPASNPALSPSVPGQAAPAPRNHPPLQTPAPADFVAATLPSPPERQGRPQNPPAAPSPKMRPVVWSALIVLLFVGGFFIYKAGNSSQEKAGQSGPAASTDKTDQGTGAKPPGPTPEQIKAKQDKEEAQRLAIQARQAADRATTLISQSHSHPTTEAEYRENRENQKKTYSECDKALALCSQALALDKTNKTALETRAVAYYDRGKTKEANSAIKAGLAVYPDDAVLKSLQDNLAD